MKQCLDFKRDVVTISPYPTPSQLEDHEAALALRVLAPDRQDLKTAIATLAESGGQQGEDDDRWYNAMELLEVLGPAAAPVAQDLIGLLGNEDARTRCAAARCLAAIGPPTRDPAIPVLKSLYYKDERRVRYAAWSALAVLVGRQFLRDEKAE